MDEGATLILRHDPADLAERIAPFGNGSRPSASLMFVPIPDGTTTVGMLSIQSYRKDAYDFADLDILQSLADYCGGALSRILNREALDESERRLREAQAISHIGNFSWNARTNRVTWSDELFRIYGESRESFVPTFESYLASAHPDDRPRVLETLQAAMASFAGFDHEYRVLLADRSLRWVHARGVAIRTEDGNCAGLEGTCQDITESRKAQQTLQESLREKEALLREIHHRVKNNLQVISSLLRLEAGRCVQPDTRGVLNDMQGRIRSMAMLHESLYRSGRFASVDLSAYLSQLATQAFRTANQSSAGIELRLHLDPCLIGMEQAIPCGLLVNELISNCLKHGFPDGRSGEVQLALSNPDDGRRIQLTVSDTGVGLPEDFGAIRGLSLGLQLVSDLARQLGGTLEIGPERAAIFTVTFQGQ